MKILALEFSSPARSVAVAVDGVVRGLAGEHAQRDMHAFALIESVLHESGVDRAGIECVAIGLGPGSYAGIRMAIAVAQGWQLARGVKLLGLSSADCAAAQAVGQGAGKTFTLAVDGFSARCLAIS